MSTSLNLLRLKICSFSRNRFRDFSIRYYTRRIDVFQGHTCRWSSSSYQRSAVVTSVSLFWNSVPGASWTGFWTVKLDLVKFSFDRGLLASMWRPWVCKERILGWKVLGSISYCRSHSSKWNKELRSSPKCGSKRSMHSIFCNTRSTTCLLCALWLISFPVHASCIQNLNFHKEYRTFWRQMENFGQRSLGVCRKFQWSSWEALRTEFVWCWNWHSWRMRTVPLRCFLKKTNNFAAD